MSYSDAVYRTRVLVPARFAATTTLTGTASGHVVTVTDVAELPSFKRRTEVVGIRVKTTTAPIPTGVSLKFLNGTNTFATITPEADEASGNASMTVANSTFAAGDEPKLTVVGTATASAAQVAGVYDVYFEAVELYA